MATEDVREWTHAPSPADAGLPHLGAALDAAAMRVRLAAVLGEHGALTVRVLKHSPGKRCVLAYGLADGTRAVGKMYRKERAQSQARRLATAAAALRGRTRVPQLLACWEDLGLVLQEWAPGERVPDYEALAGEAALVERLAVALADLHGAALDAGTPADLAAQVRRTCKPGAAALAAERPAWAADLAAIEAGMCVLERTCARTVRPCHGDFSPRQLFVTDEVITLVDLDGMRTGEAALDVAGFRVGLAAHLGEAGRALGDRFLGAYLGASGLPALPALGAYEVFGELRRAMTLWRKRPPGWEVELQRGLERGRARLAVEAGPEPSPWRPQEGGR